MSELDENVSPSDLANAEKTDTLITKCPQCGGNMIYDPDSTGLKCEYCGYIVQKSLENFSEEIDLNKLFDDRHDEWGSETHVFRCTNCGATEILARNEISKKCSFCGTSNVVETEEVSGLKPTAVMPFIIDRDQACQKVIVWAKKKWLAPRAFKRSVHPEETFGNFYPAFTFDSATQSSYKGRLGEYYYVTVRVNGKTVRKRKIKWFDVSGEHSTGFDDLLVQAIADTKAKYINKLQPYDTNHSQEYSPDFLQGYSATQYSKDGKQCWAEAKSLMEKVIRQQILAKYHHDCVQYLNVSTRYSNCTFKYVLLPVYIGHCQYTKKIYNYFVNGQTGKVTGKTPISPVKVGIIVLVVLAAIAMVLLFLYLNEGSI